MQRNVLFVFQNGDVSNGIDAKQDVVVNHNEVCQRIECFACAVEFCETCY